jgi:hypothetical protein
MFKLVMQAHFRHLSFNRYRELFKPMGFDPYNYVMKIRESIWDSNSQNGSSRGSVKVHALTLFALPGACEVTPRPPSLPATLQALALVTKPKLRLWHGPKCCCIISFSRIAKKSPFENSHGLPLLVQNNIQEVSSSNLNILKP